MADSPLAGFVDTLAKEAGQPSADARNQPKVPFQTALRLSADQEKKMLDHAFQRLKEMDNESGRQQTLQPTWWANLQPTPNQTAAAQGFLAASTFLGKRSRYDATYENDVSWRPWTMGTQNIFMDSNLVVPLSRRIARQMIAKAKDAFLGADPWFAVDPTPGTADRSDDQQSERIERFSQFKLRESNTKDNHGEAIKRALVLGECAVKTSYKVRDQIFDCDAMVLTDVTGIQIKGADGNIITSDDQTEDQDDGLGGTKKVLSRDQQTVMPDSPIWTKQTLSRRQVLFEGAVSEPIYYKDFLCPLTAKDVQEADCVVHLYDKNVMAFVDLIVKRGMVENTDQSRKEATQRIVSLIQSLQNNTSQPKAAEQAAVRPNESYTAIQTGASAAGPVAEFAEFYMWYDANEDGIAENIMIIADRQSQVPIFYDHVANITTDGLRPIEIVRINPIAGRWYGMGIIELFESYQTVTDLLVNRWNFSQSSAGRVTFFRPSNTQEGDATPNLQMNWGRTYTLKPGCKAEETLEVVYLNDTKFEAIHEMIQFFMQLAMNESGVTNANDDQAAGMQSAKLATGILEVQKSGNELFQPIIEDLKGPLERLLNREIDVILANINPEEAYTYLQGDTMKIDKLTPQDVRGLKYKCTITLTTHKNQQTLMQSAQATALVEKFYMLSPEVQARVAPFYQDQVRALCPKMKAEDVIVPVPPTPPAPPPPDAIKPSLAIAAKLELLSGDMQQLLLAKLGLSDPTLSPGEPVSAMPPKTGSTEKLGDAGAAASTEHVTKLTQLHKPKTAAPEKAA